ncbi:hypothetical protein PseBG33_2644 [Pseudomonas synxantha BG33R]|uniref:hypothetical protein n=1 Tax=Pseudomonas TaxID=286 RepID=UPI00025FF836|nr:MULTISPECIES: hypothetical protein [Pseudomonas]EIK67603.1 hypothetical protein PseBG33_2644 [Pseudomonas synxantha BG33R]QOY74009.1 hypothetical protein IH404_13420 [Pseudomonas sp. OST1909]
MEGDESLQIAVIRFCLKNQGNFNWNMKKNTCNDTVMTSSRLSGIAMPTIQSMRLPIPANWQDFETIVRDAQALRWCSVNLQKNGRPGQAQNGVDIYGADNIGRPVGVQCKCYREQLKLTDVTSEITNAEGFGGRLTALFIATATDHDAVLQQQVRDISDARVAQGLFAVSVIYWDEIVASLLLNPQVFKNHYPQISLPSVKVSDPDRMIAALEIGYHGGELWEGVELIHGSVGNMVNQDPDELTTVIQGLERRTQQIFPPKDSSIILESLALVRKVCLSEKNTPADWKTVKLHADRVSTRFHKAGSWLTNEEALVLDMGLRLGSIYYKSIEIPSVKVRKAMKSQMQVILGDEIFSAIDDEFEAAGSLSDGFRWAMRMYTLLNRGIRYRL